MSAQRHTPGPWVVIEADWSEHGFARYELEGIKTIGLADAQLIAAAPEMYDALKGLVAPQPEDRSSQARANEITRRWDAVRAAIAKAEGQTNGKA